MKVTVIGSGYVGLVSGAGLASFGHEVTCVDVDAAKVKAINSGKPHFFEEGLGELLEKVLGQHKFSATTSYHSVRDADVVLICVGTPSRTDGSIELSYVRKAADSIGRELKVAKKFAVVAVKSTVVPGSTASLVPILENASGKKAGRDFGVGMVPEFLREGVALADFFNPDRIVIGSGDAKSAKILAGLHSHYSCPVLETTLETAEMVKYASNAFLATKVGFINELSAACEQMGVVVDEVAKGMGLDKRISPHFLRAGPGWGGSCFGKDVKALLSAEKAAGLDPVVLKAVLQANELQKKRVVALLEQASGGSVRNKTVAVLGLAFKAGTDDVRESPAITIVGELLARGAKINAFDPQATANFKKLFGQVAYATSVQQALKGADACVIVTEWPEFKLPPAEFKKLLRTPVVVDGRRLLDAGEAKKAGLTYEAIGVGSV